ncbi:MAG: 2-oxoglutarate and iron-dependent oxygenase domain-containing protein [Ilumatobacteraceae bacterium]
MLPIIDIESPAAPCEIDRACREFGFFAIRNHGVTDQLRDSVLSVAIEFFGRSKHEKERVTLARGGCAWRGWFPLGGELTSGVPDLKEGYYFGRELPVDARPLHGPNIWPLEPPSFQPVITEWMDTMEPLAQRVLSLMAVGLGLSPDYFSNDLTADPTPLFRIFRYPPHPPDSDDRWGVAEHSDYGLLTLLAHDGTAGLQVKVADEWIDAPHDPHLIICNLGDMLDRLTAGRYRSTPHRARNSSTGDRYSLPFFLDPGWDAVIETIDFGDIEGEAWIVPADADRRWDRANLRDFHGTYGDWLTAKVSKVFPELADAVIDRASKGVNG